MNLSNAIAIAIAPRDALIAPGASINFTVALTNTSAAPVTVVLSTSDSLAPAFASLLTPTSFSLRAHGTALTTLTVANNAKGDANLANDTMIIASVGGVERSHVKITTRLLRANLGRAFKGIGVADHSVSPSTKVDIDVSATAQIDLSGAVLTEYLPRAWVVSNANGGTLSNVNADTQQIDWPVGNVAAGTVVSKTYSVTSPARANPAPTYQFYSTLSVGNSKIQSANWPVLLEHPLTIKHYRIGQDTPLDQMKYIAAADQIGAGIQQYDNMRVRFAIANVQASSVRWKPHLEWSTKPDSGFQIVPLNNSNGGQPFYLRNLDAIPNRANIAPSQFGLGAPTRTAQPGLLFTTENPAPLMVLNALSAIEIEFSVRATIDAAFSTNYYFRLVDEERLMTGPVAQIQMGAMPAVQLTQPQYAGTNVTAATTMRAAAAAAVSPHGSYSNLADQCASCHRQHTSQSRNLLAYASPQSNLCLACHNGTGANTNIAGQYSDPNVPANNPATSTFYSHPANVASNHTNASSDEFKGVLNRHSECGDCHNPHNGSSALTTNTAAGYTVSGALQNIAGVSNANTWKAASTYEYELCFKCHSNYTTLLSYTKPSWKMTNVAADFNPANVSFHPVEAAGKNTTAAMAASLAGTSPYKLWNFAVGSLMRCDNCHGDYRLVTPASPPAINARNAPHTSRYPNILMANYRDRILKSAGEPYSAADFALCFLCHAEAPFVSGGGNSTATNFRQHSRHVSNIGGRSGSSTDIDTPGAGPGRSICAECHYRVHGQGINAPGNPSGSRLVNFAPNVTAANGQLKWDPTTRTCYMTCHGDSHNPERY
ncbi:MAG: hypothetical protein HZB51_21775 [Chloroflexi bacterium]|nr:hypothetical protein [Chloroflexota bacterium]